MDHDSCDILKKLIKKGTLYLSLHAFFPLTTTLLIIFFIGQCSFNMPLCYLRVSTTCFILSNSSSCCVVHYFDKFFLYIVNYFQCPLSITYVVHIIFILSFATLWHHVSSCTSLQNILSNSTSWLVMHPTSSFDLSRTQWACKSHILLAMPRLKLTPRNLYSKKWLCIDKRRLCTTSFDYWFNVLSSTSMLSLLFLLSVPHVLSLHPCWGNDATYYFTSHVLLRYSWCY